jgi:thiol-disulfide isomerase/thioredoxin
LSARRPAGADHGARTIQALAGFAFMLLAGLAQAQELKPWGRGATPPLELADVQGGMHSLADYRGKVVLVNFWATWCAPCREEMPSMEKLRRAMEGKPFVILAVNVGEGPRAAGDFGRKLELGFPLLLDRDTRTAKSWGARVLPASYLVGPEGTIRYSYFGELDWASEPIRRRIESLMPREKLRSANAN